MPELIEVIYENGRLRPLKPLSLAEHTTVWVQIWPTATAEQLISQLVDQGLLRLDKPAETPAPPAAVAERQKLAQRLGQAIAPQQISEIIADERGGA